MHNTRNAYNKKSAPVGLAKIFVKKEKVKYPPPPLSGLPPPAFTVYFESFGPEGHVSPKISQTINTCPYDMSQWRPFWIFSN